MAKRIFEPANIFCDTKPTKMSEGNESRPCLTEFGVFIRLVYLWLAPADWFLSSAEGVFPPQQRPRC